MKITDLELMLAGEGIFPAPTVAIAVAKGEDFEFWTVPWMIAAHGDEVGLRNIEVEDRSGPGGTVQMKVTYRNGQLALGLLRKDMKEYVGRILGTSKGMVMATDETVPVDRVYLLD